MFSGAKREFIGLILSVLYLSLLVLGGCKADNEVKEAIIGSEMLQSLARFIGYNVKDGDRLKGVFELQIQGTQPFDAALYDWPEEGFDSGIETITFLSEDRKTIGKRIGWQLPLPDETSDLFNRPFADGTYSDNIPAYNSISPMFASAINYIWYDKDGQEVYPKTGGLTYTERTEVITTEKNRPQEIVHKRRVKDPGTSSLNEGDVVFKRTIRYMESPFDGQFVISEVEYSADLAFNGNPEIIGALKFTNTREVQGYTTADSIETVCRDSAGNVSADFDGDGDTTGDFDCFSLAENSARHLKYGDEYYVKSLNSRIVYWSDQKEELADVFYAGEFSYTEGARETQETVFSDLSRRLKASDTIKIYRTSGGSLRFVEQRKISYLNDLITKRRQFDIVSGSARLTSSREYTRDSIRQHIVSGIQVTGSHGDVIQRIDYTYDSRGRKTSMVAYDVSGDSNLCCRKAAYVYRTENDGGKTFEVSRYGCDGTDFSVSPESKIINTFNNKGQRTLYRQYTYDASGDLLSGEQQSWEYDSAGFRRKHQNYKVSVGAGEPVSEKSDYFLYERDENLFQTSKKHFDRNGNLCITDEISPEKSGVDASADCISPCLSGSPCYRILVYSY